MGVEWIAHSGSRGCPVGDGFNDTLYELKFNDGTLRETFVPSDWNWEMIAGYREVVPEAVEPLSAPITSDGSGSTEYYKLTIKNKAGEELQCEMGDIIRAVVNNDFDLGNILKASRRMSLAAKGAGKDGVSVTYDANKIKYFADEFAFWNETL
jgi:hypothetical protein